MYSNIGRKIKSWAKLIFVIGAAVTIIFGIIYMIIGPRNMAEDARYGVTFSAAYPIFKGILILILGPVCSWLVSLMVYGFGQLVDDISFLRSKEDPDNGYTELSFGTAIGECLSSLGGLFKSSPSKKAAKSAPNTPNLAYVISRARGIESDSALRDYLEAARMEYVSSGDYRSASELLVILHSDDIRAAVDRYEA